MALQHRPKHRAVRLIDDDDAARAHLTHRTLHVVAQPHAEQHDTRIALPIDSAQQLLGLLLGVETTGEQQAAALVVQTGGERIGARGLPLERRRIGLGDSLSQAGVVAPQGVKIGVKNAHPCVLFIGAVERRA